MATRTAADLFVDTVNLLSNRAPAIAAAAASQLNTVVLQMHFGDDTHALLSAKRSRLLANAGHADNPEVECYFDHRALNLMFDLQRRPVDQILEGSFDVRGSREDTLAVWRVFRLLSQRASGLRAVQEIWLEYREQMPELWGQTATPPARPAPATNGRYPSPRGTQWRALDFLDERYPEDSDYQQRIVGDSVSLKARTLWNGRKSDSWWEISNMPDADLFETMENCKARVYEEILRIVPDREPKAQLYDLIRDYPARGGKGLRPTLTVATCVALGGRGEDSIRTAAAIELFHNAFLVHDDIADESTHRRSRQTMHEAFGAGLAVNTGDAMNLLAIDTVLSNLDTVGLARTLALIHEIMHMCRETLEGQAIELGWIRDVAVPLRDEDYYHMSTKKTGWYTCISPCRIGAVCAGETDPAVLDRLNETFRLIGIAFQVQDDALNLVGETELYGKEPLGDLLEGKRTVMLIHLFREADEKTRNRLIEILRLPRTEKTQADAEEILQAMQKYGSIDYAIDLADRLAHEGVRHFEQDLDFIPESEAKGVLRQIAHYVTTRNL